MALVYLGDGSRVKVEEDATTVEKSIREAREDRTTFVRLTLDDDGQSVWVNADNVLRFSD